MKGDGGTGGSAPAKEQKDAQPEELQADHGERLDQDTQAQDDGGRRQNSSRDKIGDENGVRQGNQAHLLIDGDAPEPTKVGAHGLG